QRLLARRNGQGGRRPKGQERPYVFLGILSCSCGSRLTAEYRAGQLMYKCPRSDDRIPCTEHRTREGDILPWARDLFQQLEQITPADFAPAVEVLTSEGRRSSPDALGSLVRSLERAE